MKKLHLTGLAVLLILMPAACSPRAEPAPPQEAAGIANPASTYCVEQGGELKILQNPGGGEYGVCVFEDNYQCEEWAMMRGDCPVGGIKVTGYITPAAVYCAITGGEYAVTQEGSDPEQGTCTFKNGKTCDVWEYYEGNCDPGS